ncbi:MAG TPA: sulfotransferase [Actinomycetota bacterium]
MRWPAPLFVIGAPRSGTSLLYKSLCLHPTAAWISNWVGRYPSRPRLAALNRAARHLPGARRRVWFGADGANAYVYGKPRPALERVFPMPIEGERVFNHCGIALPGPGSPPGGSPARNASGERSRAVDCLRASFRTLTRWSGGRVLVCKRIANNQRIPLLAEAFPEARFVHLIRDGRAVAYSLSRVDWWDRDVVWWYGDTPVRWREAGNDPWELCAEHWNRELASIGEGLAAVPAGQRLEVRYSELIADPIPGIERIAAFGGLGLDAGWHAELTRLSYPNKDESWRKHLDDEARARVEKIQADTLRRLGLLE